MIRRFNRFFFIFSTLFCFQVVLRAETAVWTGGVNSDWSNSGNWDPAAPPTLSGDIAIFTPLPTNQPSVDATLSPFTVGTITFTPAGAPFTLSDGGGFLIFEDPSGTANLNVTSGANTMSANVQELMSNLNLTVSSGVSFPFSGAIVNSSSFTFSKLGLGTLILSGANNYGDATHGTIVNSGTLSVSSNTNLGTAAAPLTIENGTLEITGGAFISSRLVTLSGPLIVDTGINTSTLNGIISGLGSLAKVSGGTLILGGMNTYTGATTISGGVLQAASTGAFGNSSAVTVASGSTLDLNSFNNTVGSLSGVSGSFVTLGTGDLTVAEGDNQSFAGVISGTGNLILSNGTLILSGTNTYGSALNGTIISGGELSISSDANLGSTVPLAPVTIQNGVLLTTAGISSSRPIALTGTASVNVQGASTTSTLSGVISGPGSLTVLGSGTLVLSGVNTYSGINGTTVSGATLSISNDNNLGVTNPLTINNGTLLVTGPVNSARPIAIIASAIVNTGTNNVSFSGNIEGSGSLTKEGLIGVLTLTGTNTYSGGTIVNQGSLQGTTNGLQGNISTSSGTSVIFDQNTTGTYSGQISGTGSLTKTGSGTVIITGANTYSGNTIVSQGTLQGTTTSLQGNININSAAGVVSFNQADSGSYTGSITGVANSSLLFQGGGTFTFPGDSSSFSGLTTVSGATLIMNGNLSGSPLTIDSGAILSGIGTVGITTNDGQLVPGSSTSGTLTVNGNVTFNPGGTFVTNLSPLTTTVLDVMGTSNLGGIIEVNPIPGFYGTTKEYTILTAGSVLGEFTSLSITDPNFHYNLIYFPTSVQLVVNTVHPFRDFPCGNANECAVAYNIDALHEAGLLNPDMVSAVDSLAGQSTAVINAALDQMHPAALSAFAEVQTELGGQLLTILHRKSMLRCSCSQSNRLWVEPFGNWLEEKKQGMEIGFHAKTRGVAFGYDHQFFDCWSLGIGGAYNATDLKWSLNRGYAYVDGIYGAVYTDLVLSNFYIGGSVYAGKNWYDTVRQLKFTIVDSQAKSHSDGFDMAGQLTAAYFFGTPSCLLYPYASVDYLYLQNSSFSESGAGSFDLRVNKYTSSTLRAEAGGAWQFIDRNRDATICISPLISMGYVLELPLHRDHYQSTFAGQTIPFITQGWDMAWQLLNLRFGLAITYRCFTLDSEYVADISPEGDSPFFNQRANFRLSYNF